MKVDAVFEGGGVKGIGFAGAIFEIEKAGYTFENLVGTSAGAIVATLIAAGYSAREIKEELENLNYELFKDKSPFGRFLGGLCKFGMYKGDYVEHWIEGLLRRKNISSFGDLITDYPEEKYKYKLQIIASDLTNKRILVLPRDLYLFGLDPHYFSIARAVRMSLSIPLFFQPVSIYDNAGNEHIIVDGAVLSNYPIWLLDDNSTNPPWPTFGFKLIEPVQRKIKKASKQNINNLIQFFQALISTMLQAHDKLHISQSKGDFARTIAVATTITINGEEKTIKTTDFSISQSESILLYENGQQAARSFLREWDFDQWKKDFRQ